MMNFIRENIVKIAIGLGVLIILIIILVACSSMGTGGGTTDEGYSDMENRLQNAAIKLVDSNKKLLPKTTTQVRKIQLSTLISNGLINELHAKEDSNVVCKGYVEVIKRFEDQEDYRYTPYIKCGKYYETKTIAQYIISNEEVVTSGEGLYQVVAKVIEPEKTEEKEATTQTTTQATNTTTNTTTEQKTETTESTEDKEEPEMLYSYYYKGEYPNNYIMLGEKLYRIMEITEDDNLKVISVSRTTDMYNWDDRFNTEDNKYSGINDFSMSRLKESLNFVFTNTNEEEGEIFFSDTEKEYIVNHDFCVGKRSEKDTNINSGAECEVKENLYVGLITVQDYYKVSTATNCDAVSKQECNNYNYLYSLNEDGVTYATLTADKDNTYQTFQIDDGDYEAIKCNFRKYLYPVIYLDKNILYKSGTGTAEDPFIVR